MLRVLLILALLPFALPLILWGSGFAFILAYGIVDMLTPIILVVTVVVVCLVVWGLFIQFKEAKAKEKDAMQREEAKKELARIREEYRKNYFKQ